MGLFSGVSDFVSDNAGSIGMIAGGIIGGPTGAMIGGSIGGAISGGRASEEAARAGAAGERERIEYMRESRDLMRRDLAPYREFGEAALPAYGEAIGGLADYQFDFDPGRVAETPGYQFRLEQGSENMMRGLRASGMRQSGRLATSMMEYGQNYASQEYMNEYNRQLQTAMANYGFRADHVGRLAQAAGVGQTAATGGAQMHMNAAQHMGAGAAAIGQYRGAGIMGGHTARMGMIDNISEIMGNNPDMFSGVFNYGGQTGAGGDDYFSGSPGMGWYE